MRTGRSLTVCRSLLPGGVYLVPGGVLSPRGVLSPGGSDPGGCLTWGVSDPGGVSDLGSLLRGGLPQTRSPREQNDRQPSISLIFEFSHKQNSARNLEVLWQYFVLLFTNRSIYWKSNENLHYDYWSRQAVSHYWSICTYHIHISIQNTIRNTNHIRIIRLFTKQLQVTTAVNRPD